MGTRGLVRRQLAELRHDPGEPKGRCWAFLVNGLSASHLVPARLRVVLYRLAGMSIDVRAMVRPGVTVRGPALTVGPGSTVNYDCVFDNRARVTIGSGVGVGIGVRFITSTHEMGNPRARAGIGRVEPIVVGDGAWLGSGVTVLCGVSVGKGTVVAAGAVVTRDCLDNALYAGVPAKLLRSLPT